MLLEIELVVEIVLVTDLVILILGERLLLMLSDILAELVPLGVKELVKLVLPDEDKLGLELVEPVMLKE